MDIPCLDLTRIRSAVETFVSRAGADWSAIKRAGKAVPLGDLLDGHPLCLVEVKNLTPQAVALRLQQRGIDAALPAGNPRQPLAGFVYGDGLRALIFLNRDDPFARRRFSLAHEIGHCTVVGPWRAPQRNQQKNRWNIIPIAMIRARSRRMPSLRNCSCHGKWWPMRLPPCGRGHWARSGLSLPLPRACK